MKSEPKTVSLTVSNYHLLLRELNVNAGAILAEKQTSCLPLLVNTALRLLKLLRLILTSINLSSLTDIFFPGNAGNIFQK